MKLYKFGVMLLGLWCSLIMAQTSPNKSVRMVVPYTTGVARMQWQEHWRNSFQKFGAKQWWLKIDLVVPP